MRLQQSHATPIGNISQAEDAVPEEMAEGNVRFHPLNNQEHSYATQNGMSPSYTNYLCGACGKSTSGRIVCDLVRMDGQSAVHWCLCSCEKMEPTIIVIDAERPISQLPVAKEFHSGENWPPDLAKLYDEAAITFSAGACTATVMVVRKLLMACACHEGDADGKNFTDYVDFITNTVLTFPKAKTSIDKIRTIGNEANHNVDFVSHDAAKHAMQIATYMLNTIYSLPSV